MKRNPHTGKSQHTQQEDYLLSRKRKLRRSNEFIFNRYLISKPFKDNKYELLSNSFYHMNSFDWDNDKLCRLRDYPSKPPNIVNNFSAAALWFGFCSMYFPKSIEELEFPTSESLGIIVDRLVQAKVLVNRNSRLDAKELLLKDIYSLSFCAERDPDEPNRKGLKPPGYMGYKEDKEYLNDLRLNSHRSNKFDFYKARPSLEPNSQESQKTQRSQSKPPLSYPSKQTAFHEPTLSRFYKASESSVKSTSELSGRSERRMRLRPKPSLRARAGQADHRPRILIESILKLTEQTLSEVAQMNVEKLRFLDLRIKEETNSKRLLIPEHLRASGYTPTDPLTDFDYHTPANDQYYDYSKRMLSRKPVKAKTLEEVSCGVCDEEDYEEANMIVYCSTCLIAVHQKCYGIVEIPVGDWHCLDCILKGESQRRRCLVCPVVGGVLKPTDLRLSSSLYKEISSVFNKKAFVHNRTGRSKFNESLKFDAIEDDSIQSIRSSPRSSGKPIRSQSMDISDIAIAEYSNEKQSR